MTEPVCTCGHPRSRHFAGSMVRGHHACLISLCECRCYEDEYVRGSVMKQRPKPKPPQLTPAQADLRDKDLL